MKLQLMIAIIFTLVLASCSSNSENILSPGQESFVNNHSQVGVLVSDYDSDGSPAAGMGALGLFSLSIDPSGVSAELTPFRNTALTDVLEVVDITHFLRLAPCTDCAKIRSVSLDQYGNLVISIGIKHPFDPGDSFKPITGRNRGDLHVFNVEGIVFSNSFAISYPALGKSLAGFSLLNADGYTGYLDSVIDDIYPTTASVHPYKLHFNDYSSGNFDSSNPTGFQSVTVPPPSGNLVMPMGSDYDYQDYIFSVENDHIDFIYAIGCTYAVSAATKSQRFNPEYRIPQHNKKAASEVSFIAASNSLTSGNTLSTAEVEIYVVDMSHGVEVGSDLNQMFADSSVGSISIEIPEVSIDLITLSGSSHVSGTGHNPSDPLVYQATITNTAGASEGTYQGLIKVADAYSSGLNESPLLNGMDGIKRVSPIENPLDGLCAISEFATYQTFYLSIETGNTPPVAILLSEPDPANIEQLDTVDFDATTSYDPDDSIVLYEIDYDWNGIEVDFVADESNTSGVWSYVQFVEIGQIRVGLRVTDDFGAVDYDSIIVTVSEITNVIFVDDSYIGPPHDGSMAHPFNTIQEGINASTPGYRVWVDDSGNDYDEYVSISGKNDIIVKSVNWDTSDGGDMASIRRDSGYIVNISNSSSVTFDGFKIYGSRDYGIAMNNSFECVVKNCWITEIGQGGTNAFTTAARFTNSQGAIFRDNEISNCELNITGGFIYAINASQSAMTIEGNHIHDIRKTLGSGFNMGMYFIDCNPASGYSLIVRNNRIHNIKMADSGFVIIMYLNQCDGVMINNNLFYDIFKEPGGANIGIYVYGATNTDIINNTMYDFECDTFNMGIYMNDGSDNSVTATNNIFQYFHRTDTALNGWAVYFDAANPTITWNYNNAYQITYPVPSGNGNLNSDSLFVDPSNENFHLQTGSPCKNTGDPSILNPDNTRSDMGCYGGPLGDW